MCIVQIDFGHEENPGVDKLEKGREGREQGVLYVQVFEALQVEDLLKRHPHGYNQAVFFIVQLHKDVSRYDKEEGVNCYDIFQQLSLKGSE